MHQPTLPLNAARQQGFTLTELAIVLVIVSLLAGGLLLSIGAQVEQKARSDTQQQLQEARDALLGFAASHNAGDGKPYLPCPDTDGDGVEDRTGNNCTNTNGNLPWSTLAVAPLDGWGNRFRYQVQQSFASNANGLTLTTPAPSLRVCEQATCTSTIATALPAVILSHGKNGLGAVNAGNVANPAPASADETENTDGDADFVSHTPSPAGANEFDDMLIWLSPNTLFNRLIAAGRLP